MKRNLKFLGVGLLVLCQYCDKNSVNEDVEPEFWSTSSAETQGMNSQILDSAFIQARSEGFIDGLLVAEQYYNGYNKNSAANDNTISNQELLCRNI